MCLERGAFTELRTEGLTTLHSWLQRRSHLLLTTTGFALAGGVSVLVNVWTEGWAWPVGIGIGILIACQVLVECVRGDAPALASVPPQKATVSQTFGSVRDSEVKGIHRVHAVGVTKVRQRFQEVHNSHIVGLDEVDRL